jgi:hypothetical protein
MFGGDLGCVVLFAEYTRTLSRTAQLTGHCTRRAENFVSPSFFTLFISTRFGEGQDG